MAPIPGAVDPPTYSPHPTAGLFGLGLSRQVGATIAGGQIVPIGEGLTALHHRQIDGSAIAEHFGHGPPIPKGRPKSYDTIQLLIHKNQMKRLLTIAFSLVFISLAFANASAAAGRKGSHRMGGTNSHGKGSHYVGGHK